MARKEQVDRIINAWKTLDHAKGGSKEYEQAWAILEAVDRNASADEKEAANKVVAEAPWMSWIKKRK